MNHPKSAPRWCSAPASPRDSCGSCGATAATTQRASRFCSACAARPREPRSRSRPRPSGASFSAAELQQQEKEDDGAEHRARRPPESHRIARDERRAAQQFRVRVAQVVDEFRQRLVALERIRVHAPSCSAASIQAGIVAVVVAAPRRSAACAAAARVRALAALRRRRAAARKASGRRSRRARTGPSASLPGSPEEVFRRRVLRACRGSLARSSGDACLVHARHAGRAEVDDLHRAGRCRS